MRSVDLFADESNSPCTFAGKGASVRLVAGEAEKLALLRAWPRPRSLGTAAFMDSSKPGTSALSVV
jgi:hypothetical protein